MIVVTGATGALNGATVDHLLDRVPAERLILLADPVSKARVLEKGIAVAWGSMSVGSPNVARPDVPIWIARVDRLVTTEDQSTKTTRVELVTSRKFDSDSVVVAIPAGLAESSPTWRSLCSACI